MDPFCYLYFMFTVVLLPFLFLASLWSSAWKELTSWMSYVLCFLVFCHFPFMVFQVLECMES